MNETETPTPLTPEREREVNEVLCRFTGYGWEYCESTQKGRVITPTGWLDPFTVEGSSLDVAERRLTMAQKEAYVYALCELYPSPEPLNDDWFAGGMLALLILPVASRAAALAEVVKENQ